MRRREDRSGEDRRAASSAIGVVLIVSLTVLVAATATTFLTGIGGALQDTESSPSAGIVFEYDYSEASDKMRISIQDPGNTERLYVAKVGGRFEENDIVEATGNWQKSLGDRDSAGRIINGSRIVNNDTRAGDSIVVDNVTRSDDFVVTADKGVGTDTTVISYWESDDWSFKG